MSMPQILYRCSICESAPTAWIHTVDSEASQFRVYGKGHVWGGQIETCQRCEDLLSAGDVDGLVTASSRSDEMTAQDVAERIGNGMVALARADRGAIPIGDWLPPGHDELVADGFVPIGVLTGAVHLARAWPPALRRGVPETRDRWRGLSDDGLCWFVRSPWPSITVPDVLDLLFALPPQRVERSDRSDDCEADEIAQLRDLLARDEGSIWRLLTDLEL
jgi:hypothetical protein